MSPILDLQRRLVEVGRIRIGAQAKTRTGKLAPKKLDSYRLTSGSKDLLDAAAAIYGGEVVPWEGAPGDSRQWELFTTADVLDVVFPPGQNFTQFWEMWSGGGCLRRCDGEREQIGDGPCLCPRDYDERRDQAAEGKACKPTTRLSVILPKVPGIGVWRVETHGFYAAVELAGSAELCEMATAKGRMIPARLRLDRRTVKRGGQTRNFNVPVVEIDATVTQVMEALGVGLADNGEKVPGSPEAVDAGPPVNPRVQNRGLPAPGGQDAPDHAVMSVKAREAAQGSGLAQGMTAVGPGGVKRRGRATSASMPPVEAPPAQVKGRATAEMPADQPELPSARPVEDVPTPPIPGPGTQPGLVREEPNYIAMKCRDEFGWEDGKAVPDWPEGTTGDALRHALIAATTGRRVSSSKEVTPEERALVYGNITKLKFGSVRLVLEPEPHFEIPERYG
jgi:recombination directionality factor gp3-like protein